MNHKYIVTLTDEERNILKDLIAKGRTQGYRIKHAQILLKLDEIPENREWTYDKIRVYVQMHALTAAVICGAEYIRIFGDLPAILPVGVHEKILIRQVSHTLQPVLHTNH